MFFPRNITAQPFAAWTDYTPAGPWTDGTRVTRNIDGVLFTYSASLNALTVVPNTSGSIKNANNFIVQNLPTPTNNEDAANKQYVDSHAGNQTITLSGDVSGSGTTAITTTLATVNSNVGSFQGITVNGKGLVTAAVNMNYAPLASPAFTGTPTAPTATAGTNTTQLATTAFVGTGIANLSGTYVRWVPYTGPPQSFSNRDMTRDGDWTMVANKATSARPAPQATGPEEDLLPTWTPNTPNNRATYTLYNEWTLNQGGWIERYGVGVLQQNVTAAGQHAITLQINGTTKDTFTTVPTTAGDYFHDITPIVVSSGNIIRVTLQVTQTANNQMYWQESPGLFATAPNYCSLAQGSKDGAAAGTTAYGCHLIFTPGTTSPDWDVIAFGGFASGGTGGGLSDAPSDGTYYGRQNAAWVNVAPLTSPALTGTPTSTTPTTTDNSTNIATTAYVKAQGYLTGNQTITLSGDISGSGATAIAATLATVNSNVGTFQGITVNGKGLVTGAVNMSYAPLASPTFTGTPAAPTATAGTATTQLATTAFVGTAVTNAAVPAPSSTTPGMDGAGSAGVAVTYSRGDHVHPTDTSRAPLASPAFTGTPTSTTPTTTDNSTNIATTAFVKAQGYLVNNATITLSGDVTGSGATAIAATLATVNSNVGTFQGLTVNGKGLVTAAVNMSYAPLASPAFTGTPTAPTATAGTNTTQIATTAFVIASTGSAISEAPTDGTAYLRVGSTASWSNTIDAGTF